MIKLLLLFVFIINTNANIGWSTGECDKAYGKPIEVKKNKDYRAKISSKKNSKILKIEYLNWCIGKEKSYGFIDNKQEQNVLSKYYEEIKKLNTL